MRDAMRPANRAVKHKHKHKMKRQFCFLTGDCNWREYGASWVSRRFHNGDWPYWLVIQLTNMEEACGRDNEGQPRYNVALYAVSPQAAQAELDKAFECCGTPEECRDNPLVQVEALHSYGVQALLWQDGGNNAHKLMRAARKEATMAEAFTFGFRMDCAQNRIGTTGWEAISGDLTAGLSRCIASGTPEGNILAKMHGVTAPVAQ